MSRVSGDASAPTATLPSSHFDKLYDKSDDPWELASSWYERRKYSMTLASLPRERYGHALEPGCAIGELTRLLAQRCDQLISFDFAKAAVESARERTQHLPNVSIRLASLPAGLPQGQFDLIVVSEVLYYLSGDDLRVALNVLLDRLAIGGDLVTVHHSAVDRCYGYDGFNVHDFIMMHSGLERLVHIDDKDFVLDIFRREPSGPPLTP
jgi:SAM-dependent methyltransferase